MSTFLTAATFALGFWDQPSLLSELRHSILKSLVASKCLQPETAKLLESWPLDRSGFSAFVGDPINQPADRPTSPAASLKLHLEETLRRTCEP